MAEELLLGTSVVNALTLYKNYNQRVPNFRSFYVLRFSEDLLYSLIGKEIPGRPIQRMEANIRVLKKFTVQNNTNRLQRKPYVECYAKQRRTKTRIEAKKNVKKVSTFVQFSL